MFAVATYALTYPQLMNQALSCDLSESDLLQLRSAHEFAQLFADGIYRAQDAPLLSHLVRTASILLAERQPVSVVLAGLLHAAYTLQYFDGSVRQRSRRAHRDRIQETFGDEVETLIDEYTRIAWYEPESIREHRRCLAAYPERLRQVLIMRLANDLEDGLDQAVAYTGTRQVRNRTETWSGDRIALADQLSLRCVAEGLRTCADVQRSSQLPGFLVVDHDMGYELPKRRLWQASLPERISLKVLGVLKSLRKYL